jgi:hypothetical protein
MLSRSPARSGRLVSSSMGPAATAVPRSRTSRWVARRTTSSKSCVTSTSGMSSFAGGRRSHPGACGGSRGPPRRTARRAAARPDRGPARARPRRAAARRPTAAPASRRDVPTGARVEQVLRARAPLRRRTMAERRHDVAERGHVREQRVVLEDEADAAAVRRHLRAAAVSSHVHCRSARAPPGRAVQSRDRPEDGRLAAARRPEDRDTSPGAQVNDRSSGMGVVWRSATLRPRSATASHAAPHHGRDRQRDERHEQQDGRHQAGRAIVEGLHPIVDRDAERARLTRGCCRRPSG